MTETIKRTQSVNDGVLDDFNRDEDSPEVIWPPICEDDYGSEAEGISDYLFRFKKNLFLPIHTSKGS